MEEYTFYRQVTAEDFHGAPYEDYVRELRAGPHVDFPQTVSIETLSLCNAACSFCPYPGLERKGQKMPDHLIEKILRELEEIEDRPAFEVTFTRVNEPFLDNRIFDLAKEIERRLPEAVQFFHSNGTPLTEKNLLRLAELQRIAYLSVSVNDYRPRQYETLMALPFERILARLDLIHRMKLSGSLNFPIFVSRVGDGSAADAEFLEWVRRTYPALSGLVTIRGDWLGAVKVQIGNTPNVGCRQWFQLHLMSDGREAFCCIDSDGKYGMGDANRQHVIHEIYQHPIRRRLRTEIISRQDVGTCRTYPMLP